MPTVKNVREHGNGLVVLLDDGSNIYCVPTSGGLWLPRQKVDLVTPDDLFMYNNTVTIPRVTGVRYRKNGVNVLNGSVHEITELTVFDAIAMAGYGLTSGNWSWTFEPGDNAPTSFKWPFARSLRNAPYPGHSGVDWAGNTVGNTADIHAIAAGTVVDTWTYSGNTYDDKVHGADEPHWRGNCVVINHGNIGGRTIWSLYAHMRDAPTFDEGDPISPGQVIGRVGNTGFSSGAHLHFEIIYNGVRLRTGQGGYERTMEWMDANAVGSY